jgi:hypothetical protein
VENKIQDSIVGCSCFLLCHVLPVGCQEGKCPAYLVKERSAAKAIGNPRQPLVQTRGFETQSCSGWSLVFCGWQSSGRTQVPVKGIWLRLDWFAAIQYETSQQRGVSRQCSSEAVHLLKSRTPGPNHVWHMVAELFSLNTMCQPCFHENGAVGIPGAWSFTDRSSTITKVFYWKSNSST